MAKIRRLDDQLMNMIAAGEVVERPAGIVKELVENSIDADATEIHINVIDAGIQMIQVQDNGRGMSKEDAVLAFERHATSKIHKESDLWSIGTLGFRGEAIPSIASVSKVQLITNNGSESTLVNVEYGEMKSIEVIGSNQGTDIKVSGLFYKTPARLKHLKSIPYEMAIITSNIEKFALSHPDIAFKLTHDSREVFRTRGNGNLLEVMYQIYGGDIARSALEFHDKDADFRVEGLLALPSYTRANRNHVLIFMNDRMIRDYQISNAVIQGYHRFIPNDRFPIAIIKIYTDFKLVDVNVHPSKWQVRISKEDQLKNLIRELVEKELLKKMQAPQVRRVSQSLKPQQSELSLQRDYRPTNRQSLKEFQNSPRTLRDQSPKSTENLYTHEQKKGSEEAVLVIKDEDKKVYEDKTITEPTVENNFPHMSLIGQMHGKYILAEDEEGLFIIDQHAAEERVNFEKINKQLKERKAEQTSLLLPEKIDLSASQMSELKKYKDALEKLAIRFEEFGASSIVMREIPLWLKDADLSQFIHDVLDYLLDHDDVDEISLREDVIATKACHRSIRFNRQLTEEELQGVIDNLSQCEQPFHCPHGRPTFIKIKEEQLIKEFLR